MAPGAESVQFNNSKKQRLAGALHLPEKKTGKAVVIMHGYASSKNGKAAKLARFFSGRGYAALRFDFTGCGESEGALRGRIVEQEISDARKAIGFLEKKGFAKIGAVGSSLGGLVAIAVSAVDARVRATVALCPPTRFDDYDALAKADKTRRILFIHGTKDEIVHYEESQALHAKAKRPKKLVLVRDADHRFSRPAHLARVEREALSWFNKYL